MFSSPRRINAEKNLERQVKRMISVAEVDFGNAPPPSILDPSTLHPRSIHPPSSLVLWNLGSVKVGILYWSLPTMLTTLRDRQQSRRRKSTKSDSKKIQHTPPPPLPPMLVVFHSAFAIVFVFETRVVDESEV